ncbi:ATP phosphoribosyltransferase regulatory subunit [Deinococcus sp.]|uniref:ATP phosphoribosyltransferase regulatory subunit n=1 Tax=Deinococcus sp. TaxID=47478 RepID=UPI0025C27740|nr:ATP phosphoribosyltransferase regulatory subunit [Deinococcus sp.]
MLGVSSVPATISPSAPLLPDGTRDVLPDEWSQREYVRWSLSELFRAWGYQGVELPALEYASAAHPLDSRAFKLIDTGGQVLALRSEFTTALGRLVATRYPAGPFPLRLQYGGQLWLRAQTSELGRLREFTQVGAELIGVATVQSDIELLALARAALDRVGVKADLEVGFPGFVDAVLEDAGLSGAARDALHDAIDRKSGADIDLAATTYGLSSEVTGVLHRLTDLYGGNEVLDEAGRMAQGTRARAAVSHLRAVAQGGDLTLLFDLGVSRRYGYYTGMTFRAYVDGLNQPVLGGGRYQLANGLPGAGFAMGLERLVRALPPGLPPHPETVLALDLPALHAAQQAGLRAELAWTDNRLELKTYSALRGIRRWVQGRELTEVQA